MGLTKDRLLTKQKQSHNNYKNKEKVSIDAAVAGWATPEVIKKISQNYTWRKTDTGGKGKRVAATFKEIKDCK